MSEAWIIDACRTPRGIGKQGKGALADMHPQHLGATVLKALAERNNLNTAEVDDILWGTSTQKGTQGNDLGRMSALDAGYDTRSSGITMDRFCGSGISVVNLAAASIMSGMEDLVIAGGCEMMSMTATLRDGPGIIDSGNLRLREKHPQPHQGRDSRQFRCSSRPLRYSPSGKASATGWSAAPCRRLTMAASRRASSAAAATICWNSSTPMPPEHEDRPLTWPYWPTKLRTSSSHEEGCERTFAIATKEFVGSKGKLTGLKTVQVQWQGGKMTEVPGTEKAWKADLVLLAMGFVSPVGSVLEAFGVAKDGRGNARATTEATGGYQTSVDKVFAAGDMRRGQSLVVWAIREGRQAARAVDEFLMGESTLPR